MYIYSIYHTLCVCQVSNQGDSRRVQRRHLKPEVIIHTIKEDTQFLFLKAPQQMTLKKRRQTGLTDVIRRG